MALNPCVPACARDRSAGEVHRECRRCRPHVGGEIRMRVVDAGVDHRDHVRGRADGEIPGGHRIDVGAGDAREDIDDLADVVQPPELAERRIVRFGADPDDEVRLGVLDVGPVPEPREQRGGVQRSRAHVHRAGAAHPPHLVGAGIAGNPSEFRTLERRPELDEHLASHHLAAVDDLAIEARRALTFETQRRQDAKGGDCEQRT